MPDECDREQNAPAQHEARQPCGRRRERLSVHSPGHQAPMATERAEREEEEPEGRRLAEQG